MVPLPLSQCDFQRSDDVTQVRRGQKYEWETQERDNSCVHEKEEASRTNKATTPNNVMKGVEKLPL